MGTHGRVAITQNGIHTCREQSMDGHNAAFSIIEEILREDGPQMNYPSMNNDTDECDQSTNFGHIDYDRKIIYSGFNNPVKVARDYENYLAQGFSEINAAEEAANDWGDFDTALATAKRVEDLSKQGWTFVWDVSKCPQEYVVVENEEDYFDDAELEEGIVFGEAKPCVNSIPLSIQEFVDNTLKYQWLKFTYPGLRGPGWQLCDRILDDYVSFEFEITDPIPAKIELFANGYGRIYALCQTGRKIPNRPDEVFRKVERQAKHDYLAKDYLDFIAPPVYHILPVHHFVAKLLAENRLTCQELLGMANGQNEIGFKQLIQAWIDTNPQPQKDQYWIEIQEPGK